MEIGSVLRESRINSKMTVEQVSKILTEQGYKASQKTVYSWENGHSCMLGESACVPDP